MSEVPPYLCSNHVQTMYSMPGGYSCGDWVLDGPASGEKGSKGGPYVLQSSHANHDSRTHLDVRLPTRSFRFFELLT
jgi:hypothetical protein